VTLYITRIGPLELLLFCGQEDIAEIEKETHRLAVVNMDWRFVKVLCISSIMCIREFFKMFG